MAVECWVIVAPARNSDPEGVQMYWGRGGFKYDIRDAILYKKEETANKNGPSLYSPFHKRVRYHIEVGTNCNRTIHADILPDTPIGRELSRRSRKL